MEKSPLMVAVVVVVIVIAAVAVVTKADNCRNAYF